MDDKQMIAVHEQRIISLEARMKNTEKISESVHELAMSVKELTINQTQMLKEQQEQNERIKKLEDEPVDRMKHLREKIITGLVSALTTGIAGYILGYFVR